MRCKDNLAFIHQAMKDYSQTLAPSARAGFEQLATHHLETVADALEETPPGDGSGDREESTQQPAEA